MQQGIKIIRLLPFLLFPVVILFFSNCKKDKFANGSLSFSTDTLTFDTVFTTLGSTTQYFKVYNHNKTAIKIDNIQLAHLEGNQYRMNVDGVPGDHFTGIEIPGKDSIYVFVEVTVNPNSTATPFVIIDDVNFTIGGKTQTVFLQAFGQNAHFHYSEEILPGHIENWNNDLPHVIVTGVQIDCGATLNINTGCKVFFAGNSALIVEGTLNAIANNWQDSIVFRGARLEQYYQDLPGQWFGILFLRNTGCAPVGHFDHCVINESNYGIYAGASLVSVSDLQNQAESPVITIDNCIVKNSQSNAVYGVNANVTANNSLFYTAGDNLIKLGLGGNYKFTNCSMYNTGSQAISHQQPVLLLSNFVADGNNNTYPAPLNSSFTNCLIYGNLTNEVSFNNVDNLGLSRFVNSFNYCLIQTPADTLALFTTANYQNIFNQDPRLKNPGANDFTPSDSMGYFSPLIDYCPSGLPRDLFDQLRPITLTSNPNKYDIGAIEAK